jgi:O-acetyl-ADP-ribose deacetylase (regulator of RNase III)
MTYKEVRGDLIKMAKNGDFDVIVHGANCFCTFGAGIATQIRKEFPEAYQADFSTKKGFDKRGTFTWAQSYNGLIIVNAYTQYKYGHNKDLFDYNGFRAILKQLTMFISNIGVHRIGFPQIGAGLAGGDWSRIKEIIQTELSHLDVTVVIYESK